MTHIDQLKRVAELRAKATAGEWRESAAIDSLIRCGPSSRGPYILCASEDTVPDMDNAAFIAAAANLDFAGIVAELEKYKAQWLEAVDEVIIQGKRAEVANAKLAQYKAAGKQLIANHREECLMLNGLLDCYIAEHKAYKAKLEAAMSREKGI